MKWTLAVLGLMFCFGRPRSAEAQACNEGCNAVRNGSGQIIGWSCTNQGNKRNCAATVTQCTITNCMYRVIATADGRRLGTVPECKLQSESDIAGTLLRTLGNTWEATLVAREVATKRREENRSRGTVAVE